MSPGFLQGPEVPLEDPSPRLGDGLGFRPLGALPPVRPFSVYTPFRLPVPKTGSPTGLGVRGVTGDRG